jgi:TolB protein
MFMKKYVAIILLMLSSCKKDAANIDMTAIDAKGDILFISRRISNSADWQLFLMNADGTNQRLISNSLVRCASPALSNSGTMIAFTTYENNYYNLYIIGKDGKNQQLLSSAKQFCGSPAWSPDDKTIVFVKKDNDAADKYHIYSVNISSSNEVQLTTENDNFSPQYFSSGNGIIYTSSNSTLTGIYKMNIDGSGKRLLIPKNKSFGSPVISPDGNKIAITSNDRNGSQIFVMNADGSNLQQITFTVSPDYYDTGYPRDGNYNPVWSPNSNKIAYVSWANGSPDIFVINSNGKGDRRLTNTPLRDENPSWTRDGRYILFSSNRNLAVSSEIYIMKTQGQLQTPLTNYIGDDIYPAFIER